jgi:hypothetical protein
LTGTPLEIDVRRSQRELALDLEDGRFYHNTNMRRFPELSTDRSFRVNYGQPILVHNESDLKRLLAELDRLPGESTRA